MERTQLRGEIPKLLLQHLQEPHCRLLSNALSFQQPRQCLTRYQGQEHLFLVIKGTLKIWYLVLCCEIINMRHACQHQNAFKVSDTCDFFVRKSPVKIVSTLTTLSSL
jgi:hypothetical protein